jgi:hypothetical protein
MASDPRLVIAGPGHMLEMHYDEGWHLHQPAELRQGGSTKVGCGRFYGKLSRLVPALRTKRGLIISTPNDQYDRQITRRGIIIGAAASLMCAPTIVRATNLMPVRRLPFPFGPQHAGFVERLYLHALESSLQVGLREGRTSIELSGHSIPIENARRRVAFAQAYGFLPPYMCIYRND